MIKCKSIILFNLPILYVGVQAIKMQAVQGHRIHITVNKIILPAPRYNELQ